MQFSTIVAVTRIVFALILPAGPSSHIFVESNRSFTIVHPGYGEMMTNQETGEPLTNQAHFYFDLSHPAPDWKEAITDVVPGQVFTVTRVTLDYKPITTSAPSIQVVPFIVGLPIVAHAAPRTANGR